MRARTRTINIQCPYCGAVDTAPIDFMPVFCTFCGRGVDEWIFNDDYDDNEVEENPDF